MKQGAGVMKYVLIFVVIMGFTAVIGAIIVGSMSFEGIVAENPYEEGLKRDEIRRAHQRLGWQLELTDQRFTTGEGHVGIRLHMADGTPLSGANVMLVASRPFTDEYDTEYPMHELTQGVYRANVNLGQYGYWDFHFTVQKDGNSLSFMQQVFAENPEPDNLR